MAKAGKPPDFQYDILSRIGGSSSRTSNGSLNGVHPDAKDAVAYIPLLDVVSDTGGDNIFPKKLTDPAQDVTVTSEPFVFTATGNDQEEPSSSAPKELPWSMASKKIKSPTLRLHHELVEFCRFLEPSEEEDAARKEALRRITEIVCSMFPSAEVKVFGSYLTGLYLPTSDMDVVVINAGCTDIPRALRAIGNLLVENEMAKNIQVIPSATVPIIKFDDTLTGLAFDISFDVANGPKTAKLVTDLMNKLPPMRHLVIALKLFLQQREMNEVYQGGIGSYALLVMVASFLLQHPSRMPTSRDNNPPLEGNMGILLLDFFRLYGRTLKCEEVAISCRNGGSYFRKIDNSRFLQRGERIAFLAIEDPQDPTNDLAKGSYNIIRVQKAFDFAYRQLSSPINPDDSLLERIIRLDAVLLSRMPASADSSRRDAHGQGVSSRGASDAEQDSTSSDEATDLLDRYDLEARELKAAQLRNGQREAERAGRKANQKKRKAQHQAKAARENQRGRSSKKRVREREAEFGDQERSSGMGRKRSQRRYSN